MKLKKYFYFSLGVSLVYSALLFDLALAQEPKDNSCVACHSDYWEAVKGSVHSQNNIFCNSCHGGNPKEEDQGLSMSPEAGFIGVPDKKQTAVICGGCHSDVEFMNSYGLQTDQLARYKTSIHGKRLFEKGDTKAAVCSDCHGYHDVVAITDPMSPVYPLNLPKTCDRCHGDEKLMVPYGHPTDILDIYSKSVHGQALFEKKDISAANCVSCHGSHGAVPPGVKEIGATCGKCHVNEKKYFAESPHARITQEEKFSECVSCHGFHGIEHPSAALYEQVCVKCHDAQSEAVKNGKELSYLISDSARRLQSIQEVVKQAAIEGIFVEEETAALEEAKTRVIEMAPLQHSLSAAKISELHENVKSATEHIEEGIHQKRQDLKWRKIALIPLWIFILIMAVALGKKYKLLKKER